MRGFGLVSILVLIAGRSFAADAVAEPWVLLTQRDLQSIHDTLAANHPGPVDPQSDRYRRWLEDGLPAAAEGGNVPLGAELLACDGKTTDQLMKERLDPYYWNADIPHDRWNSLPKLFQFTPGDTNGRMASCSLGIDGTTKSVDLHWSSASRETILERTERDGLTEAAQSWRRRAMQSYSLKVYRNRLRANNEWYEPQIRWPGGAMSDEAITKRIAQLPR
jgi:hypothetical protein